MKITVTIDFTNTPVPQQSPGGRERDLSAFEEMAHIPAGEFQMGSNSGPDDEKPLHLVYVDEFFMDIYPVTNVQYQQFIDATERAVPRYGRDSKFTHPTQPVVDVTWYDAMAYAQWAGKRLPTEAEWEKAARGGLVGKKYLWGDEEPDDIRVNYGGNVGKTTPIGRYPANGYGLYDMAGNVWEWCLDEYQEDFYQNGPKKNPLCDGDLSTLLANYEAADARRVLRGGSWSDGPNSLRVTCRIKDFPVLRNTYIGFRCVSLAKKIEPPK